MKYKRKVRAFAFAFSCFIVFFLSSCGVVKHIPSNSFYLKDNYVKINDSTSKADKKSLKPLSFDNLIEQRTNSRFLWAVKVSMRFYCLAHPESESWINRQFRKYGEAPVVYSEVDAIETARKVELYLATKGVFYSRVEIRKDTIGRKQQKLEVTYYITPSKRYSIEEIKHTANDDTIQKLLDNWKVNNSLLKKENYFDQSVLEQERDRLATMLANNGYFAFNKDYIVFNIDTNLNANKLNVELEVLNPDLNTADSNSANKPKHLQYYIGDVYVEPNANLIQQRNITKSFDTVVYTSPSGTNNITNNYFFLYGENRFSKINPKTITRYIFLEKGKMYRLRDGDRTYTGLSGIKAFRYVNINFAADSASLSTTPEVDAFIRLSRTKVNNISTSLEVSNTSASSVSSSSSGNLGLEWNIRYENRNLFGNAEVFYTKFKLAVQLFGKQDENSDLKGFRSYLNMFESGVGVGLDIPKFLIPFRSNLFPRIIQPRTSFNIGYDYQYRTDYERSIPNGGFGYKWSNSARSEHSLFPIELNAVRIIITDSAFLNNLTDERLRYQYTNHLILNSRYSFFTTSKRLNRTSNYNVFIMNLETAGNILYLINNAMDSQKDENGVYDLFGIPYSQYVRGDFDYRQYLYLSRRNIFIMRGYIGAGVTYANSQAMPYEKSYFAGGPNNIRGWRMRALGPGTYNENTIYDRTGDFSLCFNAELRFPLISVLEGALFVDVGNIWLMRASEEFPGGEFKFNTFYKQLGVSGGIGVRLNTPYVVLRIDAATRMRDPAREVGDYWMIENLRFKDIVWNFGIGYPF